MKNIITLTIIALLFFSTANAERITILHVNDTHSNLTDGCGRDETLAGNIGGIARAASVIGSEKMNPENGNVLTLHGGDLFIGDPMFVKYFGVPELQIMGSLGFDAMTLGNHEFDLGVGNLIGIMQMAFPDGFNFISTNLVPQTPTGEALQAMTLPYLVKTYEDVKVGIFGFTTPEANALSQAGPDVLFPDTEEEIAAKLMETLTALRGVEGCQVVIMLSHMGYSLDKFIGENVPGIDIIIGAHDHYATPEPEQFTNPAGTTYYVQAGAYYHNIGEFYKLTL
jgi:2',3'-cyclic-nucleotide 2'-phosphodiesterase (5'-nucleotidase family)